MITIENLTKTYGRRVLFDNTGFALNRGERVGLVGRNGHGKTTLFRMILGEDYPDSGRILLPRNYRTGHVSQNLVFSAPTVVEEGCTGLSEDHREETWQVEKILSGLGFSSRQMGVPPQQLSGGFQVRLNLTKVLVSDPDLLLLDEPTNYLDITSIRWLTRFLNSWKKELILITHDRGFMDNVCTGIIGIHRSRIRKIQGDTGKYYDQIARDEEIYEKTRINDEKRRKEIELFITRFRAKARLANMVQSRVKTLEKKGKMERLEKINDLDFSFNEASFNAKYLLNARDICFSYDGAAPCLIDKFSLNIGREDRICIIGRNGRGKTTLLRLLAGDLTPLAGEVSGHPNCRRGYFVQTNMHTLRSTFTVEEEVLSAVPSGERQTARNICGAMMFEGDDALKKVEVLSGGEKSRVLLGKILAAPANLLLLDEPTNHLDLESCDALLEAIDSFGGAVIMVTHNEMFLHALATRIVAFQGEGITVHEGGYADFLERIGWEEERDAGSAGGATENTPAVSKKKARKARSEIISRRASVLRPLEETIAAMEEEIARCDSDMTAHNEELIGASQRGESSRITELSKLIHGKRNRLDSLYDELEKLTTSLEEEKEKFEKELGEL